MSLTCFVSHSTNNEERVFVYRLQTLASASDIRVLLPDRTGKLVTESTRARIRAADLVIAFLISSRSTHVSQELGVALALDKPILAVLRKGARKPAIRKISWIDYDPAKGFAEVEQKILSALRTQSVTKGESQSAALVTILGLALLALLANQSSKR